MNITFTTSIDLDRTMIFEQLFEEPLRLELEEKAKIIEHGYAVWMFVDNELAGETYGITPADLFHQVGDEIPDTDARDRSSIYCYTTSLLKPYQGSILPIAPVLMAYFQGYLRAHGWEKIIGHVTNDRMHSLRSLFGAKFGATHDHWCGSKRKATYYEQKL